MAEPRLFDKTANALKWSSLGNATKVLLQLGIGILLARVLGPKPFGLIGMAMVVIQVGRLVADAGFNLALIQKESITEQDIRACFTMQMTIGLLLFLCIWLISPVASGFYHEPMLVRILPVLGLSVIIQNVGMTAISLLKRSLDFKRIQIISIFSFTIGYGLVGTSLALMDFGVWSLVAASMTSVALQSGFSYLSVPHSIRPSVDVRSYLRLIRFGGKVTGTNVVNYLSRNLDVLVAGRLFGAETLGFYTRAFELTRVPADSFLMATQAVMFSVYSKVQGQFSRIGRTYKIQIGLMSLITMPLFWSMALCADTIIVGLFGDEWGPTTPIFRLLCVAMPFHAIMCLAGAPLRSQDRVGQELAGQILFLVSICLAVWYGAGFGITGIATGVAASYLLRYVLLSYAAIRLTGIGLIGFLKPQLSGLVLSIVPLVSIYLGDQALNLTGFSASVKLVVLVVTGISAIIVSVTFLPAKLFGDAPSWLYHRLGSSLPNWLQKFAESRIISPNVT